MRLLKVCSVGIVVMVEHSGIEPLTSSLPAKRSPS